MSQIISFEFLEPPKPKGRGRAAISKYGKPFIYTPTDTRSYEQRLSVFVKGLMIKNKWHPFELREPITVQIIAYFGMPKSSSKTNIEKMLKGEFLPTRKADLDNLQKAICDALNGIAFADDSQICGFDVKKVYDEIPRIKVQIKKIGSG